MDKSLLQKLAHLAQLELNAQAEASMCKDMSKIVNWIKKLEELDTTGVLPVTNMASEPLNLRADIPSAPMPQEQALANAPSRDSDYFRVPKVKHQG